MNEALELDRDIFLALNDLNASWLDQPMFFLSNTLVWFPLHILLLYLIFKKYQADSWIILIAIAVMIALSDQITSSIMKPFFERLRPSHDPALEGMIHSVNGYRGGLYGFASSHAANTFGTATYLYLLFPERKSMMLLFLWAAFVSYTRIYLGVHYPGDLLAGAIVGALCAVLMIKITTFSLARWQARNAAS
jgi:undecaprenyl-diphosphatase